MPAAEDWLALARKAAASREAFEHFCNDLPGRIKHLLKHLDPRGKSQRNVEKEMAGFSEPERQALQALLKYQQSFPLNHKFKSTRHESKYSGKAKNMNHLIDRERAAHYDKRNA